MAELNSSAGKAGRKLGRKKMAAPRVDLTAMVDLAFLLITFFIMTTKLTKPKAMDMIMPDKSDPTANLDVSEKRTLTVCLGKDNKIMYYLGLTNKPILTPKISGYGAAGIRKALLNAKEYVRKTTGKTLMVIVKPADVSVYDNLVQTFDEMDIAGVPSYALGDISHMDISLLKEKGIY